MLLARVGFYICFKESDVGPSKLNGPEVIETISVFFSSQKQEKGVIFSKEFGFHLWCNGAQWTSWCSGSFEMSKNGVIFLGAGANMYLKVDQESSILVIMFYKRNFFCYCPQMTAIHVRIFCWQSADSKAGSFSQITKSLVISGGTRQQSGG